MGLAANLAAMPFVSVLVMPMAVLASLLMPLGLEGPPLYLMGQGIAAMNAIAIWLAERSAFDATGAIPLSAVLALTAALAILTMAGTRLRWTAAPLLVAGTLLLVTRDLPDVLVAEDGMLVGVRLEDGLLAVNRARPRAFTVQNWLRALDVATVLPPRHAGDPLNAARDGPGFACSDTLCVARHGAGVIAHAADAHAAATACGQASVIVIADAAATSPCASGVAVVTMRDLARRGAAEIHLRPDKARASSGSAAEAVPVRIAPMQAAIVAVAPVQPTATPVNTTLAAHAARLQTSLRFSIAEPYRPWHVYRQFSRAARGLRPWQRPESRRAD